MRRSREEKTEHGMSTNQHTQQKEDRSFGDIGNDSPDSIRCAGGEDPRRHSVKVVMDSKVRDNDQSGYNHNGVSSEPESALGNNEHMRKMQARAAGMGSPEPDGTYRR